MKKSRFTDCQIMDALRQVEAGLSAVDICRELGISTVTLYKWRAKYGGMDTSMMARMKELEVENARLKKMYAEERLKAEILNEALNNDPQLRLHKKSDTLGSRAWYLNQAGLRDLLGESDLLPVWGQEGY